MQENPDSEATKRKLHPEEIDSCLATKELEQAKTPYATAQGSVREGKTARRGMKVTPVHR
jgi:hypothetical protein